MRLPTGITNRIEQTYQNFIQCGTTDFKKLHIVQWQDVCKPKLSGSLGLKNLRTMNDALLVKLGWGILSSPNNYQLQVLCSKYAFNPKELSLNLPIRHGSYFQKALEQVWNKVIGGLRWNVNNGRKIRFWWDILVTQDKPLYNWSIEAIPEELVNRQVFDFVNSDGVWNWNLFVHLLPNHVLMMITVIKTPRPTNDDDQFYQAHSKSSNFMVKLAYQQLWRSMANDVCWDLIWKWKWLQSIRTFLWLVFQGKLECGYGVPSMQWCY